MKLKDKLLAWRRQMRQESGCRIEAHPYQVWVGDAFLTVLFLELLSRKSLWSLLRFLFITPHLFLINFLIALAAYSPIFLTKRWGFARGLIAIFWSIIGIADFVLLLFRTTPFNWHDLGLIDTALQVMSHYLSGFGYVLIAGCTVLCVLLAVWLYRKAPRLAAAPDYRRGAVRMVLTGLLTVYLWAVGRWSDILPRNFTNIAEAYQTYGLVYCFTNSMISTGISKPEDYDPEKVENILNEEVVPERTEVEIDPEPPTEKQQPEELPEDETKAPIEAYHSGINVIFLQLESFFDITSLNDVTVSRDPLPNFRRLLKSCSSGFLSVPSVGAGTANTEFEILTGMNLDFFGCGEYPYQTVLREQTCESLAYCFDQLGYTAHAIHNNSATFYNRNTVFSRLGFQTFTSMEYMYHLAYTPEGWAKDHVLTENILQAMQATEGSDFIYTISVQGHGSYPTEQVFRYPHVQAAVRTQEDDEEDEERNNQMTYYAQQLYEMDRFIGELTETLQSFDEPCILVMYGDHLPTLGIEETALNQGSLFTTQYVIWSNFQMEKQDRNLEAYQLGAYVMQRMGIHEGILFRYHQKYLHEENANENAYLNSMAVIEYDMLYGDQEVFGGRNPYRPSDLKMGILPVTLDRVEYRDQTMWLYGSNFNDFSIVIINGKQYTPSLIRRDLIKLTELELEEDASVCVAQQDDYGKTILSMTKNYRIRVQNPPE